MPEKIALPAYLRETLYKKNLQINSLDRLPGSLKKEVLSGKRLLLVFHNGRVFPATLKKATSRAALLAFVKEVPRLEPRENLLVVIATSAARYVLQGIVRQTARNLVQIDFVNPRVEPRLKVPGERVIFFSTLPVELFEALISGKYFLLRDTNLSRESPGHLKKGYVYDLIIDENESLVEEFEKIMASSGQIFTLRDLSRGGACVYTRKTLSFEKETFPLYLRGSLENPERDLALNLGLIGLSREVRVKEDGTYVHIMWARKLPEEVILFLEELFS